MKVLIIRLSALGDVIQGIPLLVALKENFPDWKISWLVEETSAPLLQGHPCLETLFVLRRHWRKNKWNPGELRRGIRNIFEVWRAIRREQFDIAIDLQGLMKSGLWTWLSGAPRRLGHRGTREFAACFLNEFVGNRPLFDPAFPLAERYLEPAKYLRADPAKARYMLPDATRETQTAADALLKSTANSRNEKPLIAFCPWSAWPTKNWPAPQWKQLATELSKEFSILLIGSGADRPAGELIAAGLPEVRNLAGQTSLPLLAEIFRRCTMVVGADTGPVHLANATGRPKILMLFGSTSWKRSGPLGEEHRTLALDLPCQPCFERLCPLKHFHCLEKLEVKQVAEAVYQLLQEPACHSERGR
jgi:heptosyltransferase I